MRNVITLVGLTDRMLRRIVPENVSDTDIVYSNVQRVLLMPTFEGVVSVVFDNKSEWDYPTELTVEEIFARLAGLKKK